MNENFNQYHYFFTTAILQRHISHPIKGYWFRDVNKNWSINPNLYMIMTMHNLKMILFLWMTL